jgi:hypothetical protein
MLGWNGYWIRARLREAREAQGAALEEKSNQDQQRAWVRPKAEGFKADTEPGMRPAAGWGKTTINTVQIIEEESRTIEGCHLGCLNKSRAVFRC